jgi:hypothetical protein
MKKNSISLLSYATNIEWNAWCSSIFFRNFIITYPFSTLYSQTNKFVELTSLNFAGLKSIFDLE